jgi:Esterase/lipase
VVNRIASFLGLTLATAAIAAPAGAPIGEPHVYKQADDRSLELFVVRPADWQPSDRRPAIVFYHGGGWTGGSPAQFNEQARYFASRGLVSILVRYRLTDGKSAVPPLVCIQDSRSSFRWVRAHAPDLGIDPRRIAAAGGSAGGHLAAHLGLVHSLHLDDPQDDARLSFRPDALILFNPVLDNGPGEFGHRRIGDRVADYSPAHNVAAGAPPAVLFLGSADKLVSVATLDRFCAALRAAGNRAELHVYPEQPHGFFNFDRDNPRHFVLTLHAADEFLASLGWLEGEPTLARPEDDETRN